VSGAEAFSWVVTILVALTTVGFVLYLEGLRRLPLGERPRTPIYDRLGRQIGMAENPDYHLNPGTGPGTGAGTEDGDEDRNGGSDQ
jgi:hypothetical protein